MKCIIIIPAHNEEAHLSKTLESLSNQTVLPQQIIVVNDGSTDDTQDIIDDFSNKYPFIKGVTLKTENTHLPGSKIIHAFYEGFSQIKTDWDILCKFDADLIFPNTYLQEILKAFQNNDKLGITGGHCYINNSGSWQLENLTNKDHVRGALKAYSASCFKTIGGLKNTMGWDTIDELLAQYHNFEVKTICSLHVKHLKPTGNGYTAIAGKKQGEAFYKMRYGILLTSIAGLKLAIKKKKLAYFWETLKGFQSAVKNKIPFEVSEKEGAFIRRLRWKGIKNKLF